MKNCANVLLRDASSTY